MTTTSMTDIYPPQNVKLYSFEFSSFYIFYTSVIIKRSLQKPRGQKLQEKTPF